MMMTNIVEWDQTPAALVLGYKPRGHIRRDQRCYYRPSVSTGRSTFKTVAVVGASETAELGRIPNLSQMILYADAALNSLADAGLTPKDIDGVATAGASPVDLTHYLGIELKWVDGTSVGGCSVMIHVRHAVVALEAGFCNTVLITHGESGRSGIGRGGGGGGAASLAAQFEMRYEPMGLTTTFGLGVLRFMKDYGMTHEQLASIAVAQREWGWTQPESNVSQPNHCR